MWLLNKFKKAFLYAFHKNRGQIETIWPLIEPSKFYGNEGHANIVKIPPIEALFAQMVESTFHRGIMMLELPLG